ncbi:Coenzyme F420 hydrogenase/dehydrogenase [Fragilaria crotonensis]|nr:Coenzyme F420 hydrogenase/dehydrogenase [Fragilaria crotonensis]
MSRLDRMEEQVHGRTRSVESMVWDSDRHRTSVAEEARFGVLQEPMFLARGIGIQDAQWTGCVTAICLTMLEEGLVDAVVCIAADAEGGWSSPLPIVAKTVEDVMRGRGVKPSLAPSLQVLDQIKGDSSIRKLLFCGVGCAVQAFRAVESDLNLDKVYVLGTNCVDNSPTPNAAREFVRNGVKIESDDIKGYEFMQDFRVHVKTGDSYTKKPYFVLPGTIAEASIATSCLACFDYTNGLADVVVGYMGAPLDGSDRMDEAFQTVTVRNGNGATIVRAAVAKNRLQKYDVATGTGSHEMIARSTVSSDSVVLKMIAEPVPENGMPTFLGEVMATVLRVVGPKGVNFARYSIDYHILRNYLHVLQQWGPKRAKEHLPLYSWVIVQHYIATDTTFAELCTKINSLKGV